MEIIKKEFANVILIKENSVLMQLRDDKPEITYPGKWCLPGGAANKNEDARDAAIREFQEETDYTLHDPQFFKKVLYVFLKDNPVDNLFYEIYDGSQPINCHEGQKMEFKSTDELENLPSFPGHTQYALEALKLFSK